ncbi:hypothetical protein CAI21_15495 [Alkalilimnicola ehrlichii]|uniref:Uncharacterized protein n=1 Tax=Alkalilimnicola ehrlichii TaxID=351052 RepID=A0A3E0WMR4_9GAMM|nr:hypothetical protein [Alkalilimnicola ehrlichii]RFA26970.1 hypothetical protein CAI21_15495 [Alkalilimnicola ehrlichii]RFA34088.1 hypothetical protein CAL65_15630 [Alkalilimnicola ehrlichii]
MGLFDKLFEFSREIVSLTKEVQNLGKQVDHVQERQLDMDRRLVRVETTIEMAREQARHRALRRED